MNNPCVRFVLAVFAVCLLVVSAAGVIIYSQELVMLDGAIRDKEVSMTQMAEYHNQFAIENQNIVNAMNAMGAKYAGTYEMNIKGYALLVSIIERDPKQGLKYLYRVERLDGKNGYCEMEDNLLYTEPELRNLLDFAADSTWADCLHSLLRP